MKITEQFNLEKLFFTSDTHWFHKNILTFAHRPFENVFEHDEALIENWNSKVPKDGVVFHAGDMAFTANVDAVKGLVSRLNGNIYLVLGNHCYQNRWDRQIVKDIFNNRVMDVADILIKQDNSHLFISHFPHLFWPRNAFHLHGHLHSGPVSTSSEVAPFVVNRYDIGVDANNYHPISYDELMEIQINQKLMANE